MITTTLNRIHAHSPCEPWWKKLLAGLGKTVADDEPLPFATIFEINGWDAVALTFAEPVAQSAGFNRKINYPNLGMI